MPAARHCRCEAFERRSRAVRHANLGYATGARGSLGFEPISAGWMPLGGFDHDIFDHVMRVYQLSTSPRSWLLDPGYSELLAIHQARRARLPSRCPLRERVSVAAVGALTAPRWAVGV